MSLSIRLDKTLEESLRRRLQVDGISLSDFIREAIRDKLSKEDAKPGAYALGQHLFGRYGSGRDDLSTNRKALLREKLNAKHRR
ncbi:ribbon-helix-helix protein, CopG family [Candidatus Thiothrix anitrata]|jgi:Arc/MetJ-type ribon-helix-helix transcriptional regulator|uniref:Ribbon-helix-helix protein, CopG family n=1 Tax=Candidatus Thiothrix anitrata TaxID=2823902 RepID=A0ABX7X4X0_9GAMM|nr:ribbon-helix-helix protein, CopG family [Candidatus Thiothrix anitrata]QTR50915.1 ribbon-helix-helix protein, CopG family [Candidatus Thiothrix anitrata]